MSMVFMKLGKFFQFQLSGFAGIQFKPWLDREGL